MAHEIHRDVTNRYRMFYVEGSDRLRASNRPWHAEDTNPIAYSCAPTIEQVICDLRANVEIKLRPVYDISGNLISYSQELWRPHIDENGNQVQLEYPGKPGEYFPVGDSLGIVGPEYQVIQDYTLVEFFRPWIESGVATLETGGAILGGKGFWILAKLNLPAMEVAKNDVINPYFLIYNYHGSTSCTIRPTEIRVVCNNTLCAAHRASQAIFSIRHQGNVAMKLEEIQKILAGWAKVFQHDVTVYQEMAKWNFKDGKQVQAYFAKILKPKADEQEDLENQVDLQLEEQEEEDRLDRSRILTQLKEAYLLDQAALPKNGQTIWRAFNAVTDYVTHRQGRSFEKRIVSMYARTNLATRAFDVARKVMQGKIVLENKIQVQVPA